MFSLNQASKIATRFNGRILDDYITKSNQKVNAVIFDPTSFKEFISSKNHITFKREKNNLAYFVF